MAPANSISSNIDPEELLNLKLLGSASSKWASLLNVLIGEVLTFYLQHSNLLIDLLD
jgi:hypothetical protein